MNTHKTTRKRKEGVYKEEIFLKFIEWLAIPPKVRGATPEILSKNYGLPQDLFDQELLALRTQGKFAEYFNIGDPGTLSDWKKRIKREGRFKEQAEIKKWAQYLVPNVFFAFIQRALREGTARQMELYLKLVFDWEPPKGKRSGEEEENQSSSVRPFLSRKEFETLYPNTEDIIKASGAMFKIDGLNREIWETERTIEVRPYNDEIPKRLEVAKEKMVEAEKEYYAALDRIRETPQTQKKFSQTQD